MNTTGTFTGFCARTVIAGLVGFVATSVASCGGGAPSAPTPPSAAPPPVVAPAPLEGISLTASPTQLAVGDQLTMTWVGPSGRGCSGGGDWIALYKVGDPDNSGAANGHSDLWFEHVCGATSGTARLAAPAQPGTYEFRFMVGSGSVARSNAVTVTSLTSPPASAPTLLIDGGSASTREIGQTFWFTGSGYTAGRTVTRHIAPAVNGSTMLAPTLTADASGDVYWTFTPQCGNPKNAFVIYIVDDATGRVTNTVTQTVTGSASCP